MLLLLNIYVPSFINQQGTLIEISKLVCGLIYDLVSQVIDTGYLINHIDICMGYIISDVTTLICYRICVCH